MNNRVSGLTTKIYHHIKLAKKQYIKHFSLTPPIYLKSKGKSKIANCKVITMDPTIFNTINMLISNNRVLQLVKEKIGYILKIMEKQVVEAKLFT